MAEFETDADFLRQIQGRLCVYKERLLMPAVRVTKVELDEEGAEFQADIVPTPGMRLAGVTDDVLTFGGVWKYLHVSERSLAATYSGWTLIVRPDLVAGVIENAPGLDEYELLELINRAASPPC